MSAEHEEQAAFDQLLEPKPEIKYQRKRRLSFPYIEFTPAQQLLDERRNKRNLKIKKIIIAIILISITLLYFAKLFL